MESCSVRHVPLICKAIDPLGYISPGSPGREPHPGLPTHGASYLGVQAWLSAAVHRAMVSWASATG